ncbi:serine hydrolase [Melissospora conviva]|uniref:serine hydrolase n=1 Tax=Melissospora conviva TaxID=3388432 RepID=UPI003C20D65F
MHTRLVLSLALTAALVGGALTVPAAYARLAGGEHAPRPRADVAATAGIDVDFDGELLSWAVLDHDTGELAGSANLAETSSTESMIKVWFAADYLRAVGDRSPSDTMIANAETAIRDSDDDAANALYAAAGGAASIDRLIDKCKLTETAKNTTGPYAGWWSFTRMSARDAARMGECIADGTAAGPTWTDWILDQMSSVRGDLADQQERRGGGRWGIIDGLPAEVVADGRIGIKNGWTPLYADETWRVNCLAVTDEWSMAVLLRYPLDAGLEYGARTCAAVAEQVVGDPGAGATEILAAR